jgi:hypothetical protein
MLIIQLWTKKRGKTLRESNVTWDVIGRALKKSTNALKKFWARYKALGGLPVVTYHLVRYIFNTFIRK